MTAHAEPPTWTIDQLAAATGVTTRNIRAYQAGGLLPPPGRRGRVGVYGDEHRARLEVIRDLRARGLGLDTIGGVLSRAPSAARSDISAFAQAMATSMFLDEERPVVMSRAELTASWPGQVTPALIERVLAIGLYRRIDDDHFEVLSPAIERYGRELASLDIPLSVVLDLSEQLYANARAIARTYVDMMLQYVVRPLLAKGNVEFAELQAIATRLRPLATGSVAAVFPVALHRELESALAALEDR